MQGEDILSPDFVCLDPHNHPKISSLHVEEIHHTQTALEDQNIDHEYHLHVTNRFHQQKLKKILLTKRKNKIQGQLDMPKLSYVSI